MDSDDPLTLLSACYGEDGRRMPEQEWLARYRNDSAFREWALRTHELSAAYAALLPPLNRRERRLRERRERRGRR